MALKPHTDSPLSAAALSAMSLTLRKPGTSLAPLLRQKKKREKEEEKKKQRKE